MIKTIKALLIGSATLDLMLEQNHSTFKILPHMNPYYYKLKNYANRDNGE